MSYTTLHELLGKTLIDINKIGDEEIVFTTSEGKRYKMYHSQDCCESVYIEDIVGDLNDLVGAELVEAEEVSGDNPNLVFTDEELVWQTLKDVAVRSRSDESETWTFYKFRTKNGCVTIRWYGCSNGYYSESVDLVKI